jgi:hypothetical protein
MLERKDSMAVLPTGMNRKMIGEAIYILGFRIGNKIRVTKSGNVSTQSWRGKSAVFLMESALTSHSSSKSNKKPTAWFSYRPYHFAMSVYFSAIKCDLAILTEWWQQCIAWWELLNVAHQIICICKTTTYMI